MKAVVQRVTNASVVVDSKVTGSIRFGLLVYLGVAHDDTQSDADWLVEKISHLRIFDDADGKMNLSLLDIVNHGKNMVNGNNVNHENTAGNRRENSIGKRKNTLIGVLTVSQFTLLGDVRKGRRPSWEKAAPPEMAKELYLYFMSRIRARGLNSEGGEFQARMKVNYTNEGPVTILLDSAESR